MSFGDPGASRYYYAMFESVSFLGLCRRFGGLLGWLVFVFLYLTRVCRHASYEVSIV